MSDISQKILIEVQYKNEQAVAAVNNFKVANDEATAATNKAADAINNLKIAEQQAKANTASNREEISKLALAHKQATEEVRKAKVAVDALPGSYNAAQKELSALGKALKAMPDGLRNMTAEGKAMQAQYNKLNNELKAFDKELGNHQRNVGNYEGALKGVEGILDQIIPGFGRFSSILKTAAESFNVMGNSATKAGADIKGAGAAAGAAETEIAGIAGSTSLLVAGLAEVAVGIASVIYYLSQFRDTGEKVEQFMGGLKNQFANFGKNIVDAFTKKGQRLNLFKNFANSFNEGIDVTKQIQEVKNLNEVNDQLILKQQAQADEARASAKNVKLSTEERVAALKSAQNIENGIIEQQKDNAEKNIEAAISLSDKYKKLKQDQIDILQSGSEGAIRYANDLVKTGKITEAGYEMLLQGYQRKTQSIQAATMKLIRQQNDEAKVEKKGDQQSDKELQELAKIKEATAQSESERIASITRTLDFQREAFGKELSDTEEHYRQLIFKQQEFITKQQVIVDSKKSTVAEKSAAKNAIGVGNKTISTITFEKYAAIAKATIDHNRLMSETVKKGALEIRGIEIQNIKDSEKRELAGIDNTFKEKILEYTKKSSEYEENIRKLNSEISKTKNATELYSLKVALQANQDLLGQNADAIVALEKKKQVEIQHTTEQYRIQNKLIEDEIALLADKKGGAANPLEARDKKTEGDQVQKVLDEAALELNQVGLTENQKKLIVAKAENEIDVIHREHKQARLKEEVKFAELVSSTGLNILQQSLQRSAQAEQTYMELNKAKELQNSSLTATQKTVINEKYRIKEGQAKVKEFKQEQKLSIAKAVINGALAILKTTSELGWPASLIGDAFIVAETAAEIAVIASQKPPAYAGGGLHYQSDGRGSLLRGPGSGKSDSMNARLSNGESIINANSTKMFAPILSAINQAGGGKPFDNAPSVSWLPPGFATGGLFNSYTPSSDNGLRPTPLINTTARIHPSDISNIVSAISNIPAPIVDIKDVNYEQGKLANTQDRASYQ